MQMYHQNNKIVYYMNDTNGIQNGLLIIKGTYSLFLNESHIFSLIVRKPGVNAGLGLSAGATVPDRYSVLNIIVNITIMQPPIIEIEYNKIYITVFINFVELINYYSLKLSFVSFSCIVNCYTTSIFGVSYISINPNFAMKFQSSILNYLVGRNYNYTYIIDYVKYKRLII